MIGSMIYAQIITNPVIVVILIPNSDENGDILIIELKQFGLGCNVIN